MHLHALNVYRADNFQASSSTGQIVPPGFSLYRLDRLSGRGGGVLLAISSRVQSSLVLANISLELLIVKIATPSVTFICCAYVPPSSSAQVYTAIVDSLLSLPSDSHLILLGDFNAPDVCWSTMFASSPSSAAFCDSLYNLNLIQLVNSPTHKMGNTLDLVFSNQPDLVSLLKLDSSCVGSSDHFLITFHVPFQSRVPHLTTPRYVWNFAKSMIRWTPKVSPLKSEELVLHVTNGRVEPFRRRRPWDSYHRNKQLTSS